MKALLVPAASLMTLLATTPSAFAQLAAAKDGPIVYGHHHVNVTSIEVHKKFWIEALGGRTVTLRNDIVEFPNVYVFLRQQPPTGGTKGSTVNHVGFGVPNLRAALDRVAKAGFPIVTKNETTYPEKDGMAFIPDQNTSIAFIMGPDDAKVELVEVKVQTQPIALHHIHYFTTDVEGMKAWYVKTFDARPGKRGSFEAADLPGVNLTFSKSPDPVAGTRGRTMDHLGFEVKNLEAFLKKIEGTGVKLDRPYTKVPALNIAIAFIYDPYGTYIELTEGLDKVQ